MDVADGGHFAMFLVHYFHWILGFVDVYQKSFVLEISIIIPKFFLILVVGGMILIRLMIIRFLNTIWLLLSILLETKVNILTDFSTIMKCTLVNIV